MIRNCKNKLENFLYVALDFEGNLVVISDYADYPKAYVDEDNEITFEGDVKDFIKDSTNNYIVF